MTMGDFDFHKQWKIYALVFAIGGFVVTVKLTKADKTDIYQIKNKMVNVEATANSAFTIAKDNRDTLEYRAGAVGTIPRIEKDVQAVIERQEVIREALIRIDERLRPTYPLPSDK